MNQHLQKIRDFIEQVETLSVEERAALAKTIRNLDTDFSITEFKLERTEKVKRTTAILLEETIEELEQKRKAVEEKNRDLEIEAALEKVRSSALAMRVPADMLEVCRIICEQLGILHINEVRNVQTAIFNEAKSTYTNYEYYRLYDKPIITEVEYACHPVQNAFAKKMLAGPGLFFTHTFEGADLKEWVAYQKESGQFADPHLDNVGAVNYYWFSLGPIAWGITFYAPINEAELEVIKRFRNVFDLAYRRFADIRLAEAQARESQIELALERVRARTMAMQHSTELQDAALILFQQVEALGVKSWSSGFNIFDADRKACTAWHCSAGLMMPPFITPLTEDPTYIHFYEGSLTGEPLFVEQVEGGRLKEHYQYLSTLPGLREMFAALSEEGFEIPARQINHAAYFTYGYLLFITFEPVPGAHDIFKRFAKVFEQTYTRFLDLQKAEAQAREAQIQLALERVRARTMAMHSSNELAEASHLLEQQVAALGIKTWGCAFNIFRENDAVEWFSNLPTYVVPRENMWQRYYEACRRGETLYIEEFAGEACAAQYEYMATIPILGEALLKMKAAGTPLPTYQLDHVAPFKYGYLMFITFEPVPEAHDIFKRFAKVFEQTYTRFLDLQKAEAQAREAQIEIGLERVRAKAMSMQTSEELNALIGIVFAELTKLDLVLTRCLIMIFDTETKASRWWMANSELPSEPMNYHVQYHGHEAYLSYVSAWEQRHLKWRYELKGDIKKTWDDFLFSDTELSRLPGPVITGMKAPGQVILSASFNNFGCLTLVSLDPLSDEHFDLLLRFAKVFDMSYTRFNDLKVAELHAIQAGQDLIEIKAARKRAEDTLKELRATQRQLIQSEKMASLGELTAGIAHEIQNPLNFVNNFSEVNIELIDEMQHEIDKGDYEEVKAIANDIKENQQKINQHGKRADFIVKGMLQHSRTSTGEKQTTSINTLADEFLKLSYHGLRAKDKTFNSELITNFDDKIPGVNVVQQDIGRVLLNLFNNAFYAVSQKQKKAGNDYKAEVSVTTSFENGEVIIKVRDNGIGIPDAIKDKIMQPFFTTKPTGEGTGLGLSLTYDMVVKGHGGTITIDTKENEYTIFTIELPV